MEKWKNEMENMIDTIFENLDPIFQMFMFILSIQNSYSRLSWKQIYMYCIFSPFKGHFYYLSIHLKFDDVRSSFLQYFTLVLGFCNLIPFYLN